MGIMYASDVATTARVPSGAIVEREVPVSFQDYGSDAETAQKDAAERVDLVRAAAG